MRREELSGDLVHPGLRERPHVLHEGDVAAALRDGKDGVGVELALGQGEAPDACAGGSRWNKAHVSAHAGQIRLQQSE